MFVFLQFLLYFFHDSSFLNDSLFSLERRDLRRTLRPGHLRSGPAAEASHRVTKFQTFPWVGPATQRGNFNPKFYRILRCRTCLVFVLILRYRICTTQVEFLQIVCYTLKYHKVSNFSMGLTHTSESLSKFLLSYKISNTR